MPPIVSLVLVCHSLSKLVVVCHSKAMEEILRTMFENTIQAAREMTYTGTEQTLQQQHRLLENLSHGVFTFDFPLSLNVSQGQFDLTCGSEFLRSVHWQKLVLACLSLSKLVIAFIVPLRNRYNGTSTRILSSQRRWVQSPAQNIYCNISISSDGKNYPQYLPRLPHKARCVTKQVFKVVIFFPPDRVRSGKFSGRHHLHGFGHLPTSPDKTLYFGIDSGIYRWLHIEQVCQSSSFWLKIGTRVSPLTSLAKDCFNVEIKSVAT